NADMRYNGQFWELNISVPPDLASNKELKKITKDFHAIHKKTYGYCLPDVNVEFVNLRLSAMIIKPPLDFKEEPEGKDTSWKAFKEKRPVYFDKNRTECPIFDRNMLSPGSVIQGPAVIEEYASSTVVPYGNSARIDKFGNIIIQTLRKGV
ncbi:hypothetical protein ACFLXC_04995, partial [Chloroflexota bacterium]